MCEPATAALVLAGVGTAMSAHGMYAQGQQQKAMGEYQAAVNRNNQIIANRAAEDATQRGRIEEQQHRLKVKQVMGEQRSALAASGVQVDTGSALDVLGDTAMFGEMDALTIHSNAEREAYNFRVQGANQAASAQMNLLAGSNAARNGMWGAGASLLSGAGQTFMNYKIATK